MQVWSEDSLLVATGPENAAISRKMAQSEQESNAQDDSRDDSPLSPRVPARLAGFLYDPTERAAFCPHLKQLYVATHLHIFLDRSAYASNFVVTKKDKEISAQQLQTAGDLHELQFKMLGNDLASTSRDGK